MISQLHTIARPPEEMSELLGIAILLRSTGYNNIKKVKLTTHSIRSGRLQVT